MGYISSLSLKYIEYKTLLLGRTIKWDRIFPKDHLRKIILNDMSSVMDEHNGDEKDSISELESH